MNLVFELVSREAGLDWDVGLGFPTACMLWELGWWLGRGLGGSGVGCGARGESFDRVSFLNLELGTGSSD